jgi:hypothetical protein
VIKIKRFEPIDRAAVLLMLLLSLATGFLLLGGDRSLPKVRDFSWQNKQVGARDTAFVLTFSRPMDRASEKQTCTSSRLCREKLVGRGGGWYIL